MKTRARRTPPTKNYPNIVIFPRQASLPPGKPCFELLDKRNIQVPELEHTLSEKAISGLINYMRPYIIEHDLAGYVCIDANGCLLGGGEILEQYLSGDVPVMRISWIQDPESTAFYFAHAAVVKQYKKWGVL